MAGMQCINCEETIYQNMELDGIEHLAFPIEEWLYLSDNVAETSLYESEGHRNFLLMWKCPSCGAMMVFVRYNAFLFRAYRPVEITEKHKNESGHKCIFFDDRTWFEITEHDMPADKIDELLPPNAVKYAIIGRTFMDIYQDEACTEMLASYELIPFDYTKPYKPYPAPWNEEM